MKVYMVERSLPGITNEQLAGAQSAAIAESQKATAAGTPVRYIRSTFVPAQATCLCLFEANSADAVGDVNQTRVVSVADLGLVNAQLAQVATAGNFLKDVNASGTITVADKGITNANLATALPAP